MTKKIYYQNPYKKEFSAKIIQVKRLEDKYLIKLDKTAFYPEGGGQPADKGFINDLRVINVLKDNEGQIWHYLKDDILKKGEEVTGKLNWKKRFYHMQQHTGQHIMSAILFKYNNVKTIGFHISNNYVSIDIDKKIENDIIYEAEKNVNEIIYENVKIESFFINKKDLNKYKIRKRPTVEKNIRLVKIGDLDLTPCGGTHLLNTGELGIVKVIDIDNYKDGLKIKFICGKQAVNDYHKKNIIITECRDILSTKNNNIIKKIKELKLKLEKKDRIIINLKENINKYKVKELLKNAERVNDVNIIKKIYNEGNFKNMRMLVKELILEKETAVIIGLKNKEKGQIIIGRSDSLESLNMNDIIKKPLEIMEGNGGGNKILAQGGSDKCTNLKKAVNETYKKIKNLIS